MGLEFVVLPKVGDSGCSGEVPRGGKMLYSGTDP